MKVQLAYRDRDLDAKAEPPSNAEALTQDLGLGILFDAMARQDPYLRDIAQRTLFTGLDDPAAIAYRQAVLVDCIANPDVVREMYGIAVIAIEQERRAWWYSSGSPSSLLNRSVQMLGHFAVQLRRLRDLAAGHASSFQSDGFRRLFGELRSELDDSYLRTIDDHLRRLSFPDGVRLTTSLVGAGEPSSFTLRRRTREPSWRERVGLPEADSYVYEVDPRDMGGAEILGGLAGRGVALAASAMGESTDHILGYFGRLRAELGFLVGCLNLRDSLTAKGEPTCIPEAVPGGSGALSASGLYDPCLSLAMRATRVVGSDLDADGRQLVVITGANRGGKSTFLRSLGVAQLMLQAGMFVAATAFRAEVRHGLFTHFRREEDASLRSGKLDEELGRMSSIVDGLDPDTLVLFNESFASTNEREGSEIGRQIVRALLEAGIKVGYVTHMYALAKGLREEHDASAAFLRAERLSDGTRTFRLIEGDPLPTSHGQDIYGRVFESDGDPAPR